MFHIEKIYILTDNFFAVFSCFNEPVPFFVTRFVLLHCIRHSFLLNLSDHRGRRNSDNDIVPLFIKNVNTNLPIWHNLLSFYFPFIDNQNLHEIYVSVIQLNPAQFSFLCCFLCFSASNTV